jgi:hypothetical protein
MPEPPGHDGNGLNYGDHKGSDGPAPSYTKGTGSSSGTASVVVYYVESSDENPPPQKYQYQAPNGVCIFAVSGSCSAPASSAGDAKIHDLPCPEGDDLCGIRNAYHKTMMALGSSIGLISATKAWDQARTSRVYRVEGANERVRIINGYPIFRNSKTMLFLNFGNEKRMKSYLARRKNDPRYAESTVKSFRVRSEYLQWLRDTAVPESQAAKFPDAPLKVDTRFRDQYGLRPQHIREIYGYIIPGSAEELDF